MKYQVFGVLSASIFIGEYEADSKEDAIDKANEDKKANWHPRICHHCSRNISIGDINDVEAELIDS